MRSTETITISLPPSMLRSLKRAGAAENRTRSELVREALQTYFNLRYPVVEASKAELAAIRRGRAEIRRGQYLTLEQLTDELGTADRQAGLKGTRRDSRRRAS
ncbi:MAG: ribbon-helix-helix protein, CopG family [Acidobacteria bacterium]|nr:ribbon-helix-helix protein, CopG family [Acidobacteriota bacterium]